MKYLTPSFKVHLSSKKYRENWERVFGKQDKNLANPEAQLSLGLKEKEEIKGQSDA